MSELFRVRMVQSISALGLIAGLLLSFPLWTNDRGFPLVPLWEGFPLLPSPYDWVLFGTLLLVCFLAIFIKNQVIVNGLLPLLMLGVAVFDQNRWQVWFYFYFLVFGILSVFPGYYNNYRKFKFLVPALQVLLAGFYIWSGINKINPGFEEKVVPYMFSPIGNFLVGWKSYIYQLGALSSYVEIAIGIGLLIPRTRMISLVGAVLLHLGILFLLGPLGLNANTVVWPWNLALILMAFVIFYKEKSNPLLLFRLKVPPRIFWILALTWLAPILNVFKVYDKSLAFEIYSGTNYAKDLSFPKESISNIPEELDRFMYRYEDKVYIDTYKWAMSEFNTPPNPTTNVHQCLQKDVGLMLQ